jgi:hypothetical protein
VQRPRVAARPRVGARRAVALVTQPRGIVARSRRGCEKKFVGAGPPTGVPSSVPMATRLRRCLSRLASSTRAFGRVIRQQTPTNRPVLRSQPIAPLNRACPVVEITRPHWPAVHEPNGSRPAFHGVDQRVCAGTVRVLHSPHDRRLIKGRRQDDLGHGTLMCGKAGTILQTFMGHMKRRVERHRVPGWED